MIKRETENVNAFLPINTAKMKSHYTYRMACVDQLKENKKRHVSTKLQRQGKK